jgi:outer membrane murein-binding lipoprotein Lpp
MCEKTLKICVLLLGIILISGCGKTEQKNEEANMSVKDLINNVDQFKEIGEQMKKVKESGNPEDMATAMDQIMQMGAEMETRQFEKMESVDLPANFPKELVYNSGKIIEASDSSDETFIDYEIKIKTIDGAKDVVNLYKDLLSKAPWKITQQTAQSAGGSFTAKNTDSNMSTNIDIETPPYSKITEISVRYSGNINKE